ncbi:hypothetical protein [Halapricum desulfuricans]|uniref:hypothetical protein n=1 Tax=Halapricum desulfuricans TaxID=2841257 RepID=UPI001E51BB43|nr:hypothetical protein [Halapricum desulfuricans]
MSDVEVVIKGEVHHSVPDLKHEMEILQEGVDFLVLEKSEEESNFHIRYIWFHALMWALNSFFFRFIYTSTDVLEEITESEGGHIRKTRKSDIEIVQNAPLREELFALSIFLILIILAIYLGVFQSAVEWVGIGSFISSALIPPLLLREQESNRDDKNRDKEIADIIAEAMEDGERIVAVVGGKHVDNIQTFLPEWVEPEIYDPKFDWYHPRLWPRLLLAIFVLIFTYGAIYLSLILAIKTALIVVL